LETPNVIQALTVPITTGRTPIMRDQVTLTSSLRYLNTGGGSSLSLELCWSEA